MPQNRSARSLCWAALIFMFLISTSLTGNSASAESRTLKYRLKLRCQKMDVTANFWVYDGHRWHGILSLNCNSESDHDGRRYTVRDEYEFTGEAIMVRFLNYTTIFCDLENKIFDVGKNHLTQCDLGHDGNARFVMYRRR